MEPVPVAEKLLQTKLFGFSIKRLGHAFAIPMAPGTILMVLNTPPILFGPTVILGGIVGTAVYIRTPAGQSPGRWLIGMLKLRLGPERYVWKPIQTQEEDVTYEDAKEEGIEYEDGKEETFTAERPEDQYESESMVGDENTRKNMDFKAIHDDGVIETEEAYGLIIEITARPWLILDNQSRMAVHHSYSQFLMGIRSPIQIFTLPVPYDAEGYLQNIKETNQNKPEEESDLIEYGRTLHRQWLQNAVDRGNIRDRRHFLIVTSQKSNKDEQEGGGSKLDAIKPGSEDVDLKKQYDELWSRAENVNSSLPRTGVDTEIIDDREDVLSILHFYYKGKEAPDTMNHGWLTRPESDGNPEGKESFL